MAQQQLQAPDLEGLYSTILELDDEIFSEIPIADYKILSRLAKSIKSDRVSEFDEDEMRRIVNLYYEESEPLPPAITLPTELKVTTLENVIDVDFTRNIVKPIVSRKETAIAEQSQTFDYINSRKETLNNEQSQAFDDILTWFRYGSLRAGLFGAAGCGKTYTIQQIVLAIKDNNRRAKVCLTAPTHKAARVLEGFAHKAGLDVEVMTIHKLLGVAPERDDHGRNRLQKVQECSTHYYDLIVLDECSMISELLLDHIPSDAKFLYMGDRFQLRPVESNLESPCFDVADQSNLITPVRYTGAILETARVIRENIKSVKLPTIQTSLTAPYQGIEGLAGSKWMEKLIECHSEQLESKDGDSDAVRALAWRNATVEEINQEVRAAIYGYDCDRYVKNETLIASGLVSKQCSDPDGWASGSKWTFMNSSSECIINAVFQDRRTLLNDFTIELPVWALTVTSDMGDECTLDVLHEDAVSHTEKLFSDRKDAILAKDKGSRKEHWKSFYEDLACIGMQLKGSKLTPILRSAFCQTIHQSQGSTYKRVFIASRDIVSCKEIETRNRLLYVAITRASEYVGLQG